MTKTIIQAQSPSLHFLEELMNEQSITRKMVADKFGITPQNVGVWIRDGSIPLKSLMQIGEMLNIKISIDLLKPGDPPNEIPDYAIHKGAPILYFLQKAFMRYKIDANRFEELTHYDKRLFTIIDKREDMFYRLIWRYAQKLGLLVRLTLEPHS